MNPLSYGLNWHACLICKHHKILLRFTIYHFPSSANLSRFWWIPSREPLDKSHDLLVKWFIDQFSSHTHTITITWNLHLGRLVHRDGVVKFQFKLILKPTIPGKLIANDFVLLSSQRVAELQIRVRSNSRWSHLFWYRVSPLSLTKKFCNQTFRKFHWQKWCNGQYLITPMLTPFAKPRQVLPVI